MCVHVLRNGFDRLTGYYAVILKSAVGRPWLTVGIAGALFAGSLTLLPLLGSSFVPAGDTGELYVAATLDSGLSLNGAGLETAKLEDILRHYPGVLKVYSVVNSGGADIYVKLVDKGRRKQSIGAVAADLRKKMNAFPGWRWP